MDDKPAKRLGLVALAVAALASPVIVEDASATGSHPPGTPPGDNAIVLGNKHKPLNNNFVEQGSKPPRNNNAIVLGHDGKPLDNNRYVIGRDGKYHDKARNNTIVLIGGQ